MVLLHSLSFLLEQHPNVRISPFRNLSLPDSPADLSPCPQLFILPLSSREFNSSNQGLFARPDQDYPSKTMRLETDSRRCHCSVSNQNGRSKWRGSEFRHGR